MLISRRWQSGTALLMSLGIASAAVLPAMASTSISERAESYQISQLFPQAQARVPAGTLVPVRYAEAERIILKPEETVPVTLTVAADIRTPAGTVVIPMGSRVEGELQPYAGGTRFVSNQVVSLSGVDRPINASSDPITETQVITEDTDPDILRGAAIGAAAAAVLSEVFGSIDFLEVLGGAGLGALASILIGGGEDEVEVIVVEPETDLDLILDSEFVL